MSAVTQSVQLFLLAGVAFLVLGSLLAAVMVRLVGARLARWEPRARHRAIVVLAALPAAFAAVFLTAASLPSIVGLIAPALDHCPAHDDGHAHLCFVHPPGVSIHAGLLLFLGLLVSYAALRSVFAASRVLRARRIVAALAQTGEQQSDLGITLVESAQPVCITAGLLRPRVLLSRGLLDLLTAEERAVVIAHEHTHARRRDALSGLCVRALGALHLPGVGHWLTRELEVAAEQACDEAAAPTLADRVSVASVILTVERAVQNASDWQLAPVAVAFGACAVQRRVEALLGDPPPARSLRPIAFAIGVTLVSVFGVAHEIHHVTESVLSLIAH